MYDERALWNILRVNVEYVLARERKRRRRRERPALCETMTFPLRDLLLRIAGCRTSATRDNQREPPLDRVRSRRRDLKDVTGAADRMEVTGATAAIRIHFGKT